MLPVHSMGSDSVQGNLSVSTGHLKAHRVQTCHLLYPSFGIALLALGLKKLSHLSLNLTLVNHKLISRAMV